jgi:ketosteroid isomerase-like protein
MKNVVKSFLFLALTTMPIIVSAQAKDADAVATAVERLRVLMIDPDKNGLDAIASDKLSYGHSSGRVEDKRSFMESLTSGASNFVTIKLTDQQITIEGNTAMVRHTLLADTDDAGKGPSTVKISVFTVWVKEKNQWKLLGRQAVKI